MTARGPGHRVTIAGSGETFDVPAGERIHAAARRAGVWLPFECGWGSCGTCKATLVEGETDLLFPAAPAVDARDQRRRRIVLCQSTVTSDAVIKPLRVATDAPDERPTRDHTASLVDATELGPGIARFRFRLGTADGGGATAAYRPGQYAILELEPGLRRCYSMAGLPGGETVDFVAKHYPGGAGSGRLFALRPGDEIPIELPYGDMWLRDNDRSRLLIAGGTGISAILALARHMAAGGPEAGSGPVRILYGAATRADLVCWEDLVRSAASIADARVHGALVAPDEGWDGTRGLVTDALGTTLDQLRTDREESPAVYLAGPPGMVQAVQAELTGLGVGRDRIHVDSFG